MGMEPQFPPTPKCKEIKTQLQIVGLIHFGLALTLLIMGSGGIMDVCLPLFLCCATCSYNYCCIVIYIFYAIFQFFFELEPVG